ncbi:MAG: ASCH domain-containing protein [Devosia sp.]
MLIKRDALEAIKRGEITLQFRRWTRPSVKPGGTLKTKIGLLRIGRMDAMNAKDVTETDARRAGFKDITQFRNWLATMKEGPLFHRIEIGYLGEAGSAEPAPRSQERQP